MAAAFFAAFSWLSLAYGASPFPRPISTAMLVGAFLLAGSPAAGPWPALAAGGLAGAAFAVRWSEGVVLIPLCVWAAWTRRSRRRAIEVAGGFLLGAFLFAGVTDWLTWGRPLRSLVEFFKIMYFERPAMKEAPVWGYLYTALRWAGPVLLLLLIPAWKERRARPAMAIFASVVVLLSLFSHKEWRYLQAAIPFLAIAAAAGWERLWTTGPPRGWRRVLAAGALLLAAGYGIERTLAVLSNRSSAETEASRFLTRLTPRPRTVALGQVWAYGEHLYLGNDVEIREIELFRPTRPRAIREAASGADAAAIYSMFLDESGRREFEALGFRQIARFRKDRSYECIVFGRGPLVQGPRPKSGD